MGTNAITEQEPIKNPERILPTQVKVIDLAHHRPEQTCTDKIVGNKKWFTNNNPDTVDHEHQTQGITMTPSEHRRRSKATACCSFLLHKMLLNLVK